MHINLRKFIIYKFLNSLFLGLSVGSIFVLYTPLSPSVYSIGGVLLALGMLGVAKLYYKILNINYFYKISLFVEIVLLLAITYFLLFSYSYQTALIMYIGYQITFTFGSYLVRAETLFLKHSKPIALVDVAKQKGYLFGMMLSFIFYKTLEHYFSIADKQEQVYAIHILLFFVQISIIFYLIKSFRNTKIG